MTKFEWEHSLNKYLSELPSEERHRVIEYYRELFDDKFERGETEAGIIAAFGSPSDVALEILKNFDEQNTASRHFAPTGYTGGSRLDSDSIGGGDSRRFSRAPIAPDAGGPIAPKPPLYNPYASHHKTVTGAPCDGALPRQEVHACDLPPKACASSSCGACTAHYGGGAAVSGEVNCGGAATGNGKRSAWMKVVRGVVFFVPLIVVLSLWIALAVTVVSAVIGAAVAAISAIFLLFMSIPLEQKMVVFGGSLATVGAMLLLYAGSIRLLRLSNKLLKAMLGKRQTKK